MQSRPLYQNILIIIAGISLLLAGFFIWRFYGTGENSAKPLTREEQLKMLDAMMPKPTPPPAEQNKQIETLDKMLKSPTLSEEDQIKMLDKMQK